MSSMLQDCVDNRVIVVNYAGQIVWQYGHARGMPGGVRTSSCRTAARRSQLIADENKVTAV
jgi:hypothetical protein